MKSDLCFVIRPSYSLECNPELVTDECKKVWRFINQVVCHHTFKYLPITTVLVNKVLHNALSRCSFVGGYL